VWVTVNAQRGAAVSAIGIEKLPSGPVSACTRIGPQAAPTDAPTMT
jgi:hypothetical protein